MTFAPVTVNEIHLQIQKPNPKRSSPPNSIPAKILKQNADMIGVPQGSVLAPLLFNIYINDLFMFVKDAQICNYADDTTIYACDTKIESVIKTLESDALKIAEWFPNNFMKLIGDKCHLMVFGDKSNDVITIKESTEEKLLGVILDKNLCFKQQVKSICKKAGQKLVIKWAAV